MRSLSVHYNVRIFAIDIATLVYLVMLAIARHAQTTKQIHPFVISVHLGDIFIINMNVKNAFIFAPLA